MMTEDWFIPASFMRGPMDQDKGKRWPEIDDEQHTGWCELVLAVLKLSSNQVPGPCVTVRTEKLSEYQIACALRDLDTHGWEANRESPSLISIRAPIIDFFFMNKRITVLLSKTSTVREFMLFLVAKEAAFANAGKDNISFDYAFLTKDRAINTFDNRHKRIRRLLQPGDAVQVVPWRHTAAQCFKFNLLERDYTHDSDCAICLCEFDNPLTGFVVLECMHKFHTVCFSKVIVAQCPTCRGTSALVPFCKKITGGLPITK